MFLFLLIYFYNNEKFNNVDEINYVCSLGSTCHIASFLKENKFKITSYPFDWIFSNPTNVINCIKDNFKIFLDKSYYINIEEKICGHSLYHNKMFFHHNPLINEEHYNYYTRCINRFNNLLKYPQNKLFIMMITMNKIDNEIKNDIINFNNRLDKFPKNYKLLVIFHLPNNSTNYHISTFNKNIHFLEFYSLSISNGSRFEDESDNIYFKNIFNETYNINLLPIN
jgi:hypothetical protein